MENKTEYALKKCKKYRKKQSVIYKIEEKHQENETNLNFFRVLKYKL